VGSCVRPGAVSSGAASSKHHQNRDPGSSQLGVLASRSQLELGTEIRGLQPQLAPS
jgi:hypothetical protein